MKVAAELANEYGTLNLPLSLLAKKLKIKPPSLYNHFDGLADLKRELTCFSLKKLYGELAGGTGGAKPGTEKVLQLSKVYLSFARGNPGLYEAALSAPGPEDQETFTVGEQIVELVREAIGPMGLNEAEVIHAVRGLRSIMHGFASLEQKGGFGCPLDLEESYTMAILAFMAGIKNKGTE